MKKFLSVFCAIAMMATLIVPSYAADATFSVADVIAENGQATLTLSVDLVDMSSMESIITYDSALTIAAKPVQGDFSDFTMTPNGNIANNPYKVIFDGENAITESGDAFSITFNTPAEPGEYEVEFDCCAFGIELEDEAYDVITAKIIVEEAEEEIVPPTDGEVAEDFGAGYAYIRENKRDGAINYELCLISALKNLEGYSAVGFEVKVGNGDVAKGEDQTKAYKSFEFNGESVDIAQLGDGFEYLYYDSFNFEAADADTVVYFRSYGVTENGTVYGTWKSIDSIAK